MFLAKQQSLINQQSPAQGTQRQVGEVSVLLTLIQ